MPDLVGIGGRDFIIRMILVIRGFQEYHGLGGETTVGQRGLAFDHRATIHFPQGALFFPTFLAPLFIFIVDITQTPHIYIREVFIFEVPKSTLVK